MNKTWSKYNIFFERDGLFFVYCPLTNSFAKLSETTYHSLRHSFENGLPVEDVDLVETLRSMKSIDTDDEYELLRIKHMDDMRRFSKRTLSLTINPTLACNFRCSYCFEKRHENKHMTVEVEDRIVEYAKSHVESQQILVTWFGGEPLLQMKTIRSLTAKLIALGKPYRAGIITNGYLLTEDVARSLKELRIDTIQITLDGRREVHDTRRHLADGSRTFDTIVTNIKRCQVLAPDVKICIRINVDESNKDDFIELRNHICSMNLPNIDIYPGFVKADDPSPTDSNDGLAYTDKRHHKCETCDRETVISFLINLYREHGLEYIGLYPKTRGYSCVARNIASLVIGPGGELYDCWNDVGDQSKVIGKIGQRISNLKLHLKYIADASQFDDADCLECKLLPVCNGGCPRNRILKKDKGEKKDNCILSKDHLEDFLYMHYLSKNNFNIKNN